MQFILSPGNALACKANSHRSAWDGSVCEHADSWHCGAEQNFRSNYCATGDTRCFHINNFNPKQASMVIEEGGGHWLLGKDIHAMDDQILVIWGDQFHEPLGVREGVRTIQDVFGIYRVKRVTARESRWRTNYVVEPYPDGWTRVHQLRVRMPPHRFAGGRYIRQVDRLHLLRLIDDLEEAAGRPNPEWYEPDDEQRFNHFRGKLDRWLDIAAERAQEVADRFAVGPDSRIVHEVGSVAASAMSELGKMVTVPSGRVTKLPKTPVVERVPAKESIPERKSRPVLIERPDWIRTCYGEETLQDLRVASLTKALIILRGNPGVGKSHMAVRLLDDDERRRTCIIPVSATWRGREDLLGYVNPINQCFEPTPFTHFLFSANKAWNEGDRRLRLVVFEEFNLSQPEHWLADVLAISQFEDDADRHIELGGKGVSAHGGATKVYLSKALRFLGTINSDHTTRPLSLRVLDRAAVVHLSLEPRDALARAGVQVEEDQVAAITDLDYLLKPKGASFSLRSAFSLKACREESATLGLNDWGALDLILAQEVLSKVRLLSRDPIDEALIEDLGKWSQGPGRLLTRCSRLIDEWEEMLRSGRDVIQA